MSSIYDKDAKGQYFHYFRVWFVLIAILAVVAVILGVKNSGKEEIVRTNFEAPGERVYDYADLLTDAEEQELRAYIAEKEAVYHIDFVIVTMSQAVEGADAQAQYGYRYADWKLNMQDIADDFWDNNHYGYNKGFEGDGSLLLDNRYPGQRGEHLSTSGKVEHALSSYEIDNILYDVDAYYDSNPAKAYKAYIDGVCKEVGTGKAQMSGTGYFVIIVITFIIAMIYRAANMSSIKAANTVTSGTYAVTANVRPGRTEDNFIHKHVTQRRIESSSSGGSGGGGGHHTSSGGASHGGGSHRH